MNKVRGQKKDINRILKTLKLQQKASRYFQTLNQDCSNDKQANQACRKIIYASNNKKNYNQLNTRRQKYRYERISTQNQVNSSLASRYKSLDARKDTNFLRVSQRNKQFRPINRNPYETKKKINSIRRQTSNSSNQRRTLTQQTFKHESIKKNYHFNAVNLHQAMNLSHLIEQAKNLANNGSIIQSQTLIQRILKEDPQNKQILYLSANNNFKQMNYLKCIGMLNQLQQIDPLYNKSMYLMLSICYNNKGQKEEAMHKIDACISHFPDFYDAYFHKAKLFLKNQDLQNATKSFKKALKVAKQPFQCCLKLGQCYQKQNLYQLALKLYDKVTKQSYSGQQTQQRTMCILRKAQCQKKLQKYQSYIKSLKNYLKQIDRNTTVNLAKINYEIAYGYYKLGDQSNTIMQLQQVLIQKNKNQSTAALILQTLINIKKRDFYEAYHCLLRKQHLQINEQQLQFYQKFCEGVLCLMKRKFEVGLQKLVEMQSQVSQVFKDEFQIQIATIYPMYLSYAYFCVGRTDKCIKIYKRLIQQNVPQLKIYRKGLQFNLVLCLGIQDYKHKKLGSAKLNFEKSTQIYPHKSEGYLYLAIVLIQLYLKDYNEALLKRAKAALNSCINNLKQLNNNYAASAFYVKSALSAFLGQWDEAINQIDQSIERAEDNDAKSFYLRALILACCHNFKQAISQVSIAISLNCKDPTYFLLRSKCQQIQGDGNRAFMDLQEYISICPDDAQIHKFAGNLLFQNGAFQDALQAYQNGDISIQPNNFDVFLTRAKTYFLIGNFSKASEDMSTANKLRPVDPSINFDISVVNILNDFFLQSGTNALGNIEKAEHAKQQLQNLAAVGEDIDYGRIFKKIQILMLLSLFLFYMGKYREAARKFKQTLTMKQQNFASNQSDFEEQLKEKQFFVAQMHYNRAICFLMLSEHPAAIKCLEQCRLQEQSKTKSRLNQLINILKNKKGQTKILQVFSQKNKMSKLLNQISINLGNQQIIKLRLSIPFPKVQPPQINPKFQIKIMRQIDIQNIQKKPQAPWILREQNSIKFTQKIQQFSRLQINNSQLSKIDKQKRPKLGTQQQQLQQEYDNSFQSLSELRYKLKLDDKVENKLNKLLNKQT